MREINFSENFHYIFGGLLATQHDRCHNCDYSPRGQTVSTSHLDFPCQDHFRPAVNRQPIFPREMTRRSDSDCPPTISQSEFRASYSVRILKTSDNTGFLWKPWFLVPPWKPWPCSEMSKTDFLELLGTISRSHFIFSICLKHAQQNCRSGF